MKSAKIWEWNSSERLKEVGVDFYVREKAKSVLLPA